MDISMTLLKCERALSILKEASLDSTEAVHGISIVQHLLQCMVQGRSSGVNFAIPMDLVRQIVPQLMSEQ